MQNDVFSFLWNIPDKGFTWIQTKVGEGMGSLPEGKPEWVLTDGLAIGQPYSARQYSPLKMYTGLFRIFGQLPCDDRDAILGFANEYGNLGIKKFLDLRA